MDARADERSTGYRAVVVAVSYDPALSLGMKATKPQLILNGILTLLVGRIAGIQCDGVMFPSCLNVPILRLKAGTRVDAATLAVTNIGLA